MDEKTNWATHVLAVFLFLLTALTSPVSMIRQVVSVISAFSSSRRNTPIKIEGEEKGLTLLKPAVVNKVAELLGELLVEILCRLPARDLLQLRSVCRNWNAIISSPSLVSMHLRNYTNGAAGSASQFLMVSEMECYDRDALIKLFSPDHHGDHVEYLESEMPVVTGPCNGIFLMARNKTKDLVRLWNPATGKSRKIAVPPVRRNTELHYYDSYGFGLDPASNDFKIVMIRHFSIPYPDRISVIIASCSPEFPAQVMVYTPGTGTWRELEELRLSLRLLHVVQSYNYLNGFFFWVCISPVAALAFDLENEVFRVVNDPVPANCDNMFSQGYRKQLLVYKDALALFLIREGTGGYDLWLLSEEWCWIKHSTAAPFIPPIVSTEAAAAAAAADAEEDLMREDPFMLAVGWWRDDELILVRDSGGVSKIHELVLFDPVTQATKVVADDICVARRVLVYKESLVSVG